MNGFQWNSWQVVTAINRWNDDSLTETVTGTRELRQNNRIDVNRCRRDVIQVLTPSERIHKFHCTQMRPRKQFNISLTNFINFFYIYSNLIVHWTIYYTYIYTQYISIDDKDTFNHPLIHCPFCLPWQRWYGKHLQWMLDKCSSRGIIWLLAL